ncbi:hypothetical protein P7C73_g3695, partial [Tremellales sp. Uapishka_1]
MAGVGAGMDIEEDGGMEMHDLGPATSSHSQSPPQSQAVGARANEENSPSHLSNSDTSSTSRTPSLHSPQSLRSYLAFPTTWLQVYLRRLRRAHEDAAKKQALERLNHASSGGGPVHGILRGAGRDESGWGLGRIGLKEQQESTRRLEVADRRLREDRLLEMTAEEGEGEGATRTGENEWEDVESPTKSTGGMAHRKGRKKQRKTEAGTGTGTGWSWWGPLRDWRLADRSAY